MQIHHVALIVKIQLKIILVIIFFQKPKSLTAANAVLQINPGKQVSIRKVTEVSRVREVRRCYPGKASYSPGKQVTSALGKKGSIRSTGVLWVFRGDPGHQEVKFLPETC